MRTSDWSSDVCSSDLGSREGGQGRSGGVPRRKGGHHSFGHRQGELSGRGPARQFRCVRGCDREGEAVGREGQICPEDRAVVDHGAGTQGGRGGYGYSLSYLSLSGVPAPGVFRPDRTSVVSGKRVSVRVDLGGRRII